MGSRRAAERAIGYGPAMRDSAIRSALIVLTLGLFAGCAGGDLNTFFYFDDIEKGTLTEPAVKSFVDRGHQDAHQGITLEERYTSFDPFDMVLDIILPRGLEVTDAGRCPPERCGSLSDHLPVFTEVQGVLGE